MKIKKYVAQTMPEAMRKIRADLGADAVILNSKEITQKGILGLFKKRKIEVIAALDPQPLSVKKEQVEATLPKIKINPVVSDNGNVAVLNEIKNLKRMIEMQSSQENDYLPDYQAAFNYLVEQEIEENLAKELVDIVVPYDTDKEIKPSLEIIMKDIQVEIEKRLTTINLQKFENNQQVIHFVGPTGVGKTTTLAKIAAHNILKERKKVAFITTDTYRIAAIDQLKTYARILGVPVEVAYSIDDYKKAVNQFDTYDLILVDTAGRNFRDEQYVKELLSNIDQNIKTYIVLSLTAKQKDIIDIYHQFDHIRSKEVIFTKLDETRQYGSILNIALENQIKVAYLTNGQDVPDDLITPTPQIISNFIVGGYIDS